VTSSQFDSFTISIKMYVEYTLRPDFDRLVLLILSCEDDV